MMNSDRRPIEHTNFSFLIILTLIGMLSAIINSPIGLSLYSLSLMINYTLSIYSLPYFVFSTRFFIDAMMLYLALVLRSKLMYIYMPFNLNQPAIL